MAEFLQKFVAGRSEEHTSELQSHSDIVCRLLLEKRKRSARLPVAPLPRADRPDKAGDLAMAKARRVRVTAAQWVPTKDDVFFLMIRRPPRSTPLSLHDALPILARASGARPAANPTTNLRMLSRVFRRAL